MYVLDAPGRPEAPPRLGDGAAERARPSVRRGDRPRVRPAPVLCRLDTMVLVLAVAGRRAGRPLMDGGLGCCCCAHGAATAGPCCSGLCCSAR